MEVIGGQPGGRKPLRRLTEARQDLIESQRQRARIAREVLARLPHLRKQQAAQQADGDAADAEIQAAPRSDSSQAVSSAPAAHEAPTRDTTSPTPTRDQIDLSATLPAADPAREERVQELREQFEAGTLHTPERLERAAESLLGSKD